MQSAGQLINSVLASRESQKPSDDKAHISIDDYEKHKEAWYNASRGKLEGYTCLKCLNRGDIAKFFKRDGMWYERIVPCECMQYRNNMGHIRMSGLEEAVNRMKFDNYKADEPYQQRMLEKARAYLKEPDSRWLFMGGAVGSGKTHLCTAVCRELLLHGRSVEYMKWAEKVNELKACIMESEEYEPKMRLLKTIDVLYIDDFLKPTGGGRPSDADIRMAYEIINERYTNRLRTIISSERLMEEITDIDEATGSRIAEMSRGYKLDISRDKSRNYRLQDTEVT